MAVKVPAIIRVRRGTAGQWQDSNPILQEGEIGYITQGDNAGKLKVGDGVNTWNNLPLTIGEVIWGEIKGVLANQTDLQGEFDKTNAIIIELENTVNSWIGRGGYLEAYDFGTATPTQDAITNEALSQIGITDPTEIWNGTKIKNLNNGHTWTLTNTQDTDPVVFEWSDQGPGDMAQFGANAGGYIVGADGTEGIGYVQADASGKGKVTGLAEMNSLLTMGPPDWSQANGFNPVLTTPYTAKENGYIYGRVYGPISIVLNGSTLSVSQDGNYKPYFIGVKKGDVISWSGGTAQLFWVPPVINPPSYFEQAPLLDYSTVEQDTGRKWITGQTIYQKTISYTGVIGTSSTVVGPANGATNIIKFELNRSVTAQQIFGVCQIVGSNFTMISYSNPIGPETWNITVWYTK